jgi:FlaA1/EpsC-like NDP-sugar epimerase
VSAAPFAGQEAALLGRPLLKILTAAGERVIDGTNVLVTGAAGSVGSALVARLARGGAARIVAVDHHEASLFRLGRDLPASTPIELRLADVRNTEKMRRVIGETRPSAVFHMAAYKHVPFGETEPDETIAVNVLATAALARICSEAGVGHYVYSSSDKAVNPLSLYGATKRIAESAVLAIAQRQPTTTAHVVRYVNVLGTSGSVIETFAAQARAGRPLTLTDDRMTRYWMAMDEATALVIHSLALGQRSRSLPDTGEPIPVKAMAVRVSRLVHGDDHDPDVVITGARPGERMAEELFSRSEQVVHCDDGPVLRVLHSRQAMCDERAPIMVDELARSVVDLPAAALRARVMAFAEELQ